MDDINIIKEKIEIANLEDVIDILNIVKQNLIQVRDINRISEESKRELEEQGFLRKEIDKEYFENLITNSNSDIYIAKNKDNNIIGFASFHKKNYNIEKVRDITGNFFLKNDLTKELFHNDTKAFAYLEQISVLPEYKSQGIGTAIFQTILSKIDYPIVAFIVEKPILNKASREWHIYNGFEFVGTNISEYKGMDFKFQIFVNWNKK